MPEAATIGFDTDLEVPSLRLLGDGSDLCRDMSETLDMFARQVTDAEIGAVNMCCDDKDTGSGLPALGDSKRK